MRLVMAAALTARRKALPRASAADLSRDGSSRLLMLQHRSHGYHVPHLPLGTGEGGEQAADSSEKPALHGMMSCSHSR